MTIAQDFLADFRVEAAQTRALLEVVPEEHLSWRPHEKSMTLAQLTGHIAENPGWMATLESDALDILADMDDYQPCVPERRAQLLDTLDEGVATCERVVGAMDDDVLRGTWTLRAGERVIMSGPRAVMLRSLGLRHWVHHRGQLTVYLRLLDVPVPGTFGPTADFPMPEA